METNPKMLVQEFYHLRHGRPGQYALCQGATVLAPELPKKEFDGGTGHRVFKRAYNTKRREHDTQGAVQLCLHLHCECLMGRRHSCSQVMEAT